MKLFLTNFRILFIAVASSLCLLSCGGFDPPSARDVPTSGIERAKKNVREGRGISLKGLGGVGNTTYQFSTSNPMWRATFDTIDFMPLLNVDYSGGMIITDWYSDKRAPSEALKITIRFLSNEIRSDSIKIIIHKRVCNNNTNCTVTKISSKLEDEIRTAILRKAAVLEKQPQADEVKKKRRGVFGLKGENRSAEDLLEEDRRRKSESGR